MDYLFNNHTSSRHFQTAIAAQRFQQAQDMERDRVDKETGATVNEVENEDQRV